MTPTVQYAEQRVMRRGVSYDFSDRLVLDLEAEYGFQVNPMTGKSYADGELCEARDRAWRRLARAGIQRRNIQRITERNLRSKRYLREMLNLDDPDLRRAEKLERQRFIASTPDESPSNRTDKHRAELEQIELVTPLGERGPPAPRASSKDRGPGRPIRLGKSIVPTGMSGGDV